MPSSMPNKKAIKFLLYGIYIQLIELFTFQIYHQPFAACKLLLKLHDDV